MGIKGYTLMFAYGLGPVIERRQVRGGLDSTIPIHVTAVVAFDFRPAT